MRNGLRPILACLLAWMAGMAAHAQSGPPGPLSLDVAIADAERLAARYAGAEVLRVEGDSMLPYFGFGSVLVTKPVAPERLRVGMVVAYRNRFGETVAHRIEAQEEDGWVVRGYNNAASDSTRVQPDNLVGVVYATFYSTGRWANPVAAAEGMVRTKVALAAPAR